MKKNKAAINTVQALIACVFVWFGHPYVAVLIAVIHF